MRNVGHFINTMISALRGGASRLVMDEKKIKKADNIPVDKTFYKLAHICVIYFPSSLKPHCILLKLAVSRYVHLITLRSIVGK